MLLSLLLAYRIARKFGRGKCGESSVICQTKLSKLVLTINNLPADLLICQTFFHQMLEKSQFAKLFPRQTFPLYGKFWLKMANFVVAKISTSQMYQLLYFVR